MELISSLILKHAHRWVGEKEIPGNMGFENPELDRKMRAIGFCNGESYCIQAVKMVWLDAYAEYNSFYISILQELFDKNCYQNYLNFSRYKDFGISKTPIPGAISLFQHYKGGRPVNAGTEKHPVYTGHAGIFLQTTNGTFLNFEGNTNLGGSSNGDGFYEKNREPNYFRNDGLRFLGFVNPRV
jgi:hypothetical protein